MEERNARALEERGGGWTTESPFMRSKVAGQADLARDGIMLKNLCEGNSEIVCELTK